MTQYISTIKTQTVEVDDFDPSVVVTASGSILSDNLGIASSGTIGGFATVDGSVYAADIGVSFNNEGSSVTVSDFGVVYGEIDRRGAPEREHHQQFRTNPFRQRGGAHRRRLPRGNR